MSLKKDLLAYLAEKREQEVTVGKFNESIAASHGAEITAQVIATTDKCIARIDGLTARIEEEL